MSNFDQKRYEEAKNTANLYFKNNGIIFSRCLGKIYLNSDGLRHLIFKDTHHKRDWKNQLKRFELLRYARPILENMGYYQEYWERIESTEVKDHGTTKTVNKKVTYWCFIAVINDRIRIKTILRKIGENNIIFWSVIPYWKVRFYKDIRLVTLHTGNPTED